MNIKNENTGSLTENVASELDDNHKQSGVAPVITVALALWFGLTSFLASQGAFAGPPGSPPLPIFFGFALPLAVFFAAYFGWGAFRAFILGIDLRLVAAIQAWRWAGLGFLSLYAYGVLPGLFAFPAGLGDMAVGFVAPWIVLGLVRHPSFATSRRFVVWNIMGILDLVVAVSLGTICSGFIRGLALNVTTSAMAQLPLIFIPAFLVPLFIMLHFTALFQARQMARPGKTVSAQSAF
ncbi:MAG TPA: hypothetical protein VK815_13535 [Candidatus Acidoferrales bacterium]|jgi:hypothetical protein|nr:hypothetical protein [Candidatus Acidoferrales bacterium]